MKTVRKIYEFAPNLPIVILSGLEDREFAIEVVHKGAQDYLVKGEFDSDILVRSIHYAIERAKVLRLLDRKDKELQEANQQLEQKVKERTEQLEKANLQLRMAQLQLRRCLEEEQEMNELKSRIITSISHEYRTPLTTIASSTELLEYYSHKWTEEKKQKHFTRIKNSIKQMTDLVDAMFFLNQAQSDRLEFNPTAIDLGELLRQILEEQETLIENLE
ncbi:sensor histidine kinase KdpD [Oxynema sp. CENA135]|uniref:sensor histidine kinase n=1 Tax=Oxynema sp. CENA135 TaxID=984206 RepID=UPI001F3BD20F|nr:histidine kinase dimerization/phospho-acceptor domain-containing protein [Oxynema sp. CENA135]